MGLGIARSRFMREGTTPRVGDINHPVTLDWAINSLDFQRPIAAAGLVNLMKHVGGNIHHRENAGFIPTVTIDKNVVQSSMQNTVHTDPRVGSVYRTVNIFTGNTFALYPDRPALFLKQGAKNIQAVIGSGEVRKVDPKLRDWHDVVMEGTFGDFSQPHAEGVLLLTPSNPRIDLDSPLAKMIVQLNKCLFWNAHMQVVARRNEHKTMDQYGVNYRAGANFRVYQDALNIAAHNKLLDLTDYVLALAIGAHRFGLNTTTQWGNWTDTTQQLDDGVARKGLPQGAKKGIILPWYIEDEETFVKMAMQAEIIG